MSDGPPPVAPLRIHPPASGHRGDPFAPWVCWFGTDPDVVIAGARAMALAAATEVSAVRVVASRSELESLAGWLTSRGTAAGPALTSALHPVSAWRLRTRSLPLDRPIIMGIVNLTEDSFSGDGVGADSSAAVRRADELRAAGATIVDVGGETARADRPVLEAEAEARLVAPAIEALAKAGHIVSIDTYKAPVARAALDAGAEIVNDISGLTLGIGAVAEAARAGAGYVLNYSYSVPKRRPDAPPVYSDVVAETLAWMYERVRTLGEAGLARDQIAVDPGIAFGKSHQEDIEVLRRLDEFTSLGLPLLLAHSRKNFIGSINGQSPADRDLETHVVTALAWPRGARIFRVHDAAGARRALEVAAAITTTPGAAYAPADGSWPWRAGANVPHTTSREADRDAPPGQRW